MYDFQHLLLNRREIEKLLDIDLSKLASDEDQSLNDYAMFPVIPLEEVIGIFLGLNPTELNRNRRNSRYWTIFKAIEKAVRRGDISAEIEQDFDINGNEIQFDIFLSHEVAENWAKTHGLKWNIPPYRKPLEDAEGNNQAIELENQSKSVIDSTELQEEKAKNTQLQAENECLKAELKAQQDRMAELEQKLQQSAVDSEPVLEKCKAYDVRERETHLLMIGALSNLLAGYKQNYQKGSSGINQSAISRDIEHEIIQLLQPPPIYINPHQFLSNKDVGYRDFLVI